MSQRKVLFQDMVDEISGFDFITPDDLPVLSNLRISEPLPPEMGGTGQNHPGVTGEVLQNIGSFQLRFRRLSTVNIDANYRAGLGNKFVTANLTSLTDGDIIRWDAVNNYFENAPAGGVGVPLILNYDDIRVDMTDPGTNVLQLRNDTPATGAIPRQNSPVLEFVGHGWDGAADQLLAWRTFIAPSGTNASSTLIITESLDEVSTGGGVEISGGLFSAAGTINANDGYIVAGSVPAMGTILISDGSFHITSQTTYPDTVTTGRILVTGTNSVTDAADIPTAITIGGAYIYRVSGTDVAIADGGTGASAKTAAFDNLSPLTTRGDLIYHDGTNNVRKAVGAANRALTSDGTDALWTTLTADFLAASSRKGSGAEIPTGTFGATPNNGDFIVWDTGATEWINTTLSSGDGITVQTGTSPSVSYAAQTGGTCWMIPSPYVYVSGTSATHVANEVRVWRFFLPMKLTVDSIIYNQATGSASSSSLGIYSGDGNTKLIQATVRTTGTGIRTTSGLAVTLGPGHYYLAWTISGTTAGVFTTAEAATIFQTIFRSGTVQTGSAANASAAGVLPTTLGAITAVDYTQVPIVKLQN